MTVPDDGPKQLTGKDFLRKAVEEIGGPTAWLDGMGEFYEAVTRLWDEYDALMKKHPDKWVAMGKDGILAVCDSFDDALSAVEPARSQGSEFVVKFLNSDPLPLILPARDPVSMKS